MVPIACGPNSAASTELSSEVTRKAQCVALSVVGVSAGVEPALVSRAVAPSWSPTKVVVRVIVPPAGRDAFTTSMWSAAMVPRPGVPPPPTEALTQW